MISYCLKAVRGCNDRFAFCPFVTLSFLLSSFLFYLVSLLLCLLFTSSCFPCYFVFSFILFSLLSCLVSLVTLSLYYSVLFPMLLCLPFTLSILYLSTKPLVYLSTRSLVHSMFINVKY